MGMPMESRRVTPMAEGRMPFLASLQHCSSTSAADDFCHCGAVRLYGIAEEAMPLPRECMRTMVAAGGVEGCSRARTTSEQGQAQGLGKDKGERLLRSDQLELSKRAAAELREPAWSASCSPTKAAGGWRGVGLTARSWAPRARGPAKLATPPS